MITDWVDELSIMQSSLHEVKSTLDELSENEDARLLRVKPIISVLQISCDFIAANLNVISNLLAKP